MKPWIAVLLVLACLTTLWAALPRPRPDAPEAAHHLARVTVVAQRATVTGYDREAFGGWAAAGACTSREMAVLELFGGGGPGEGGGGSGCAPPAGSFAPGPYTGWDISPGDVEVDHVYPLAAAWDQGAHAWDPGRRRAFANDPANLIAVAAEANQDKSDATPEEWLPGPRRLRCPYAARFAAVADTWDLPVTEGDWRAMARSCGLRTDH